MKSLDKKTKKIIYAAVTLTIVELIAIGILYWINQEQYAWTSTIPISYEITLGIILILVINLVLAIILIIKGIRIKKGLLVVIAILSLIPIPVWYVQAREILEKISKNNISDVEMKPVLYLYPEQEEKVTVTFEHPENLLTTYPKYETKWKVTTTPEGSLYDKNGKYYYALYWDEKNNTKEEFKEGFYVTKENAIDFLEETLTQIGLTRREQNEFIMYWLPILEENEKSIVNYTLTEERQEENELIITPKPDSLLRVAINIKKVDKEIKIEKQELPHFTREGFTAVEWGGTIYK